MAATKQRKAGSSGETVEDRARSEARFIERMRRMESTHATITPNAGEITEGDEDTDDDE